MPILFIECAGFSASAIALFFCLRTQRVVSHDTRIALSALLLTVMATHALDAAEWGGVVWADLPGDVLKILTPAAWLIVLFVVTRDRLAREVGVQAQHIDFLFEEVPTAIAILDAHDRCLRCSRAWVQLVSGKRDTPPKALPGCPPDMPSCWQEVAGRCRRVGQLLEGEEVVPGADVSTKSYYRWVARPWLTEGELGGTILVVHDISAEVEQEQARSQRHERLLRAQALEALGEVAAGVAHDMNNLLTVIVAETDLAEQDQDAESLQASLDAIRGAVCTASGMTAALLDLSRQRRPSFERLRLEEVVLSTASLIRRSWSKTTQIETSVPDEPCWIAGDRQGIQRLLLNLAVNARDAMGQGGTLRIVVRSTAAQAELSVQDTGEGIPVELRQKILEPFFTTKEPFGTGLGLAVVKRVVEQHNGELTLTSTIGKGSCFKVYFPVAAAEVWVPAARASGAQ